ncbi:unnamed protein product [Diabrotica balteata]|uniref:Uncharacterized protein n=1 Tax=Diabrotica balteata TaxID=107213 RepID=A0A9N9X7K5_DIABA|nr:unnamed protein product [Diabrotica balteata]
MSCRPTCCSPCSVMVCYPFCYPCCQPCCQPSCPPKEVQDRNKLVAPPTEPRPPIKCKRIQPCYYSKPTDIRSKTIKFDEKMQITTNYCKD